MVIWTQRAKADLRAVYDFIAHDSGFYAKKVTQEISRKTDILEALPTIGRIVTEVGDENIREISLYAYRVIYQIDDCQIYILAIAHKRRNLKSILGSNS